MADHSFDPMVAEKVGVLAAILYKNIQHWCEKNRLNNKNIKDGKAWTYHSRTAFMEQFPYISDKQLRTALNKLEEEKFIASGCFNKDNRDRTKWYCDLRVLVVPKGPMEDAKRANSTYCQKGQPLPDNKTNTNKDINPIIPKAQKPKDILLAMFSEEMATAIIDHRKSLKKPLTPKAAKLLVGQFEKTSDPEAAANEMILRGWQSFKASWGSEQGNKPTTKADNNIAALYAAKQRIAGRA